jgi:HEAT repeat protein
MHHAALQPHGQVRPEGAGEAEVMADDFDDAVEQVLARIDSDYRDSVRSDIDSLRNRGVASWADVVAVLNDRSAGESRMTACWLLGRWSDEAALGPLVATLHDPDPRIRAEAAKSLGTLDNPRAVPDLIAALQADADAVARVSAAYALGQLDDPRAVDPLLAKLADTGEEPRVRGFVAEALIFYREQRVVAALIAVLSDPSAEVRFWAAFALGELKDPAALGALERLAQTDDAAVPRWGSVRDEAAAAIETIRARSD